MKSTSLILGVLTLLLGCTSTPITTTQKKIPFADPKTYEQGNWILLAQSDSKDWYYDPATLSEGDDGVVNFWSYWRPQEVLPDNARDSKNQTIASISPSSDAPSAKKVNQAQENENGTQFDPKVYGPYLQKIDCLSHFHAAQSLIDGSCDLSEAPADAKNGAVTDSMDCWRKVKPKTAIAFLENRVCGRKFPMEVIRNYFLYQSAPGQINASQELPIGAIDQQAAPKHKKTQSDLAAMFYEVINNEYIVIDDKKNIREMRVSSVFLDKNLTPDANFIYRANCTDKTDSLSVPTKAAMVMRPIGASTSLSGVAFNRLCANHGSYMHQVKNFTQ
jgi:hypothetical protein